MAAAVLYDFSDVAMSNERSANVGNTQLNGNWLPCKTFDAENRRAELADGRIFQWRQAGWQPAVH